MAVLPISTFTLNKYVRDCPNIFPCPWPSKSQGKFQSSGGLPEINPREIRNPVFRNLSSRKTNGEHSEPSAQDREVFWGTFSGCAGPIRTSRKIIQGYDLSLSSPERGPLSATTLGGAPYG